MTNNVVHATNNAACLLLRVLRVLVPRVSRVSKASAFSKQIGTPRVLHVLFTLFSLKQPTHVRIDNGEGPTKYTSKTSFDLNGNEQHFISLLSLSRVSVQIRAYFLRTRYV